MGSELNNMCVHVYTLYNIPNPIFIYLLNFAKDT